jgi:phospholipase/carboxylesterase
MSEHTIKQYTYWPKSEKPKSLVIMLHGLGADGKDLIGLSSYFAADMPDTAFVAPDAPFPCDVAPVGYQWFSLKDTDPHALLQGVNAAAPIIDAFIDSQIDAFGVPANKIALLGFSQGTMVSLYTAPKRENGIAAVLGYSGALIGGELLEKTSKSKPAIHLVHGTDDQVVPFTVMDPAKEILETSGFDVETTICKGVGHSISEEGLAAGISFLKKHLY